MDFIPHVLRDNPEAVLRYISVAEDRGKKLSVQLLLNQIDDDTFRFDVCYSHS